MSSNPLVAVIPKLNPRQREALENLDPIFGDSVEEKVKTIVVQFLTTWPHLYDDEVDD